MASVISNPVTSTDRSRRKPRKQSLVLQSLDSTDHHQTITNNTIPWRTATELQKYSSKLLQALRHVRTTSAPASSKRGHLVISEAADRSLAVTAKGRSRWSRALLKNRMKLKLLKAGKKPKVAAVSTSRRTRMPYSHRVSGVKGKNNNVAAAAAAAVQKKGLVLGKLVPGCKKQPLSVVLEEAHDYISALEMQVKAMTALAELLSVAAGAVSSGSLPPQPSL